MSNSTLRILVTGCNGQLGNECQLLSRQYPDCEFVFTDFDSLPIENEIWVEKIFSEQAFDYCINCAAYTAVDKAESEKELAMLINATGVANLAKSCRQHDVRLIHISTDYVFDGENSSGYETYDATGPLNVYGATKLLGEQLAMKENKETVIIRTSWVYSFFGNNFVKTMMRLMGEKKELNIVQDQIGRPTYAADLAAAIFHIIFHSKDFVPGIFHYANQGAVSWFDFANAIREIGKYRTNIQGIPTVAYPTPAKRPSFSILKTDKIEKVYGIAIPDWKESLQTCMHLLTVANKS